MGRREKDYRPVSLVKEDKGERARRVLADTADSEEN